MERFLNYFGPYCNSKRLFAKSFDFVAQRVALLNSRREAASFISFSIAWMCSSGEISLPTDRTQPAVLEHKLRI